MDKAKLEALLERVEKATGPDRELDAMAFQGFDPHFPEGAMQMHAGFIDPANFATGPYTSVKAPAYTASIDAALALVERVLPEHDWILQHTNGGLTIACQLGPNKDRLGWGETPALAILAALLTALIAQEATCAS